MRKKFINHYECSNCENAWIDNSDRLCDDMCPECGEIAIVSYTEDFEDYIKRHPESINDFPD